MNPSDKTAEVRANLERARTSLDAARALLDQGYPDYAASRSYYGALEHVSEADATRAAELAGQVIDAVQQLLHPKFS